jgi:autotransporter-associated beta strand protein
MKPKSSLRAFLLGCRSLLAVLFVSHSASAANRWWEGGSVDLAGNGNSASTGGAGTWNTTLLNWDAGAVPRVAWNNAGNDTAIFGGTAGAVALTAPITVGGLTFNTIGYTFTSAVPATNFISVATNGLIVSAPNTTNALANVSLATGNNTWRFQNSNATNNFANTTLLTISKAISGAGTEVVVSGSGNSPVYLTGTLSHGGGTTVNAGAALGLATTALTSLADGSISVGANSTVLRTGGSFNQTFLNKLGATSNAFALVSNNAGTSAALNLTNFPNASLATWDNAGTQTFGFTGAITAGANGYLFGSSRVGNNINVGGTSGTATVTANILTGTGGLALVSGSLGNMFLWAGNTFSGNTINSATGRTISINSATALQNSAIDTSGAGTFILGTGSSGTGGNSGAAITTPTLGGLIGSKNLLTDVIATAGYNAMTSLTLNPGTGASHTYSGVIANSTAGLALTKSGAGTQILSGQNTFAGNLTISGGTLVAAVSGTGGNSALGGVLSTRTINVNTGGTLRFDVGNVFNNDFASAATSLPALNIAGGTLTNGGTATNSALGNITLAGGTLSATTGSPIGTGQSGEGWGSWNLNGTVTSTGNSTISSTAPGGIPITLSATATNGFVTTFDVQSGILTASAVLGNVTRVGNETVSGLAKTGAGTMILSGVNTYTGNTAISAGVLTIATTDALPGYATNGRYAVAGGATLAVQNGVSDADVASILATNNFASGASFGFDTGAGNRSIALNLTDLVNGPLGIVKLGADTLTLTGTNNYTGGTTVLAGSLNAPSISSLPGWNVDGGFSVASGASLVIPNTVSEAEVTTILGTTNLAAGATISFDTALGDRNYVSGITDTPQGLLNVSKTSPNTLTLSGVNTYSGTTSVTEGALTVTGTIAGNPGTSGFTFGTAAATTAVTVTTGADLTLSTLQGANNTAAATAYRQTGGTVTVGSPGSVAESGYAANAGYGFLELSGGNMLFNSRFTVALNGTAGGKGITRVGGGAGAASLAVDDLLAVSRGGGSIGDLTVLPNGTVTLSGTGSTNMLLHGNNGNGTGFLNVVGGTFSSPVRAISWGNGTSTNTSLGLLNLGSGILEIGTNLVLSTIATGTNRGYVNFSGGTLKLAASTSGNLLLPATNGGFSGLANNVFGPLSNSTANLDGSGAASAIAGAVAASQDFAGGAVIDTGAFSTTISAPLVAPAGGGVAQGNISITDAGSGYSAPPLVVFSNPATATSTPAAGYALVSGGTLTGIVITCPGSYDAADTVTVTLIGGGPSTPAAVADIPGASMAANTSGGLAKLGSGTLTLSGANTYTGATAINAGTLNLGGTLASNLSIASNANLQGEGSTTGSLTFGGTSTLGFDPTTAGTYLTAASVNGTGGSVTVAPSSPVTGTGIVVLGAAGGITGTAGGVGNNFVYTGRGNLYFNVGNTELLIDTAPLGLVWKGNDGTNPSLWDLNTTTNWDSGSPQNFFTDDPVTFDDTAASFIVGINAANVSPGNITFNNTTAYTVQGAFGITGGATLTKGGTGTTVIQSSNSYTGVTTVNEGVLNIQNANALGSTTAGTTVVAGAALELQGGITSDEAVTLNGSGVSSNGALRNISGNNGLSTAPALASASSIGVDADTLTIPGLTGALALTKVGAGTLNITGASAATPVTVEAGTLFMGTTTGNSTTTTLGGGTAVTLNGSSNLTLRRTNTGAADLVGAMGGTGSLSLVGNNTVTSASGDFTINNASTFSGGTSITAARAAVSNSTGLGSGPVTLGANGQVFVSATSLTLANDFNIGGLGWNEPSGFLGALRLNGTTISGNIALTSDTRITGAGSSTLSGQISGSHSLDFFEDTVIGTITLSGDNSHTGTTTINSMGTSATLPVLVVAHNNALGTTAGGTVVFGSTTGGNGSQLSLANGITVTDETLTLDSTANGYRSSLITASNGTATWDGNVITAGTGGIVAFNANGATGNLTVGSSDADTITGTVPLTLRGTGTGTVNSTISLTAGGLLKTDNGTWTIHSNNNSYPGDTTVSVGALIFGTIADSGVNSSIGAGSLIALGQNSTNPAGTLRFTGASGGASNRAISIINGASGGSAAIENTVSGQTLALSGQLTAAAPANACTLTLTGAGDGVLSGGVAGSPLLTLNKSGAGAWTLTGAHTATGATNVTAGTLTLDAASVVNSATSVGRFTINGATAVANIAGTYNVGNGNGDAFIQIQNGGTLNFSGNATLTNSPTGGGFRIGEASAGTMNMTAGSLAYTAVGGSNFLVGRTSGANGTLNLTGGILTVAGAGGFIIANDANTTGVVNIGGTGTLVVSTATARIGNNATSNATINLDSGGTILLSSPTITSAGSSRVFNFNGGSLQSGAAISLPALTRANVRDGGALIDTTGGTITLNQALDHSDIGGDNAIDGGLTKSGTGTLVLNNTVNTYNGPTTVSQGTLSLVGGSQASAITVADGASLGFTVGSTTSSTATVTFNAGSTVTITGTPTLASYTLMTAASFDGITPVLSAPVAGYELVLDGTTTLKLVQLGYGAWASFNGAGPNLDDDHDNDGVTNGVEYFIGGPNGNTTGFTALPGVVDTAGVLSITWPKGAGYAGVYGTDFEVETSATLSGTWTTETLGGGNITDTGTSVKYTFPGPLSGKNFARLKVTGP